MPCSPAFSISSVSSAPPPLPPEPLSPINPGICRCAIFAPKAPKGRWPISHKTEVCQWLAQIQVGSPAAIDISPNATLSCSPAVLKESLEPPPWLIERRGECEQGDDDESSCISPIPPRFTPEKSGSSVLRQKSYPYLDTSIATSPKNQP